MGGGVILDALGATVLPRKDEAQPRQVSEVGAIQGHQRVAVFDGLGGEPQVVVAGPWRTARLFDCSGEYAKGRTFQPITSFRTAVAGSASATVTHYDRPVSFGIRRMNVTSCHVDFSPSGVPVAHAGMPVSFTPFSMM